MTDNPNNQDLDKPLLSNEEFSQLMAAEYTEAGEPVDETAKRRVKDRLKRTLVQPKRRYNHLAAVALLLLCVAPLLYMQQHQPDTRIKGNETGITAPIDLLFLLPDGSQRPVQNHMSTGDIFVFRSPPQSSRYPILLLQINDGPLEVELEADVMGPKSSLVQQQGKVYGYQVEPHHQSLTFCLVVANTPKQAKALAGQLSSGLERMGCTTVSKN